MIIHAVAVGIVFWQIDPLAAGADHIEDRIDHLTHIQFNWPPWPFTFQGEQRLEGELFGKSVVLAQKLAGLPPLASVLYLGHLIPRRPEQGVSLLRGKEGHCGQGPIHSRRAG